MKKNGRGFMTVLYTSANLERSDCLASEHTQQFVHCLSVVILLERGERKGGGHVVMQLLCGK